MSKTASGKKIKALLFDLGKVILDFNFTPAFERLSKHCPQDPADIRGYFSRSGLEVLYDGGCISSLQFYREVKRDLVHRLDFGQFKKIWNEIFTLNRDVAALIGKAKPHYRLVLVSNTNAMHFDYIRARYAVLKQFDRFVLSYKEKVRKPDARIYEKAIRSCQASPEEILYIDDREDLTAAAAGLGLHTFTFRKNTGELLKKMKRLGVQW